MLVARRMSTKPVTISANASIQEAIELMKNHSVRHLPVVDQDGNLVGWITDGDLRGVLIASMIEDLSVGDVMIADPVTVSSTDLLEDAALLISTKKIGGMPVVDNGKLVGMISYIDFLKHYAASQSS